MGFECKKCGTCCNRIKVICRLEKDDAELVHFFDGKSIDESHSDIMIMNVQKRCAYLDDNNLCTVYNNRPKLCREYQCIDEKNPTD